ncbi:MAG: MMPL family transporter [Verrucomicrobiales bacterium]
MTRRYILLFIVSVLVLSAIAFTRLSFNVNPLDLLPGDARGVKGLRVFSENFAGRGELIITLESEDRDVDLAAESLARHLKGAEGLVSWVEWQPLWEKNPAGAAQLSAYVWLNGNPGDIRSLVERLAAGRVRETLAGVIDELSFGVDGEALALVAYDPFSLLRPPALSDESGVESGGGPGGKYVSGDGRFRAVYLGSPADSLNYSESADWIARVRAVVNEWQGKNSVVPELRIGFTGEPAFSAEIGGGMQRDMSGSILVALVLIHLLFWLMHRRFLPLAAIFFTLLLILSATVITGSLVLGKLSVMSVGFAAILIGLAVDYGMVLYQQSRQEGESFGKIYQAVGRGILWAAFTTAAVFASLGLSSLPGIRELGVLVALGIVLGAGAMLLVFGPMAARLGKGNPLTVPERATSGKMTGERSVPVVTIGLCAGLGCVLLVQGFPGFHRGLDVLRPMNSPADDAFSRISEKLFSEDDVSLPLVVVADSLEELEQRAVIAEALVEKLRQEGIASSAVFPAFLIPSAGRQRENAPVIRALLADEDRLRAALDADFTAEAQGVLNTVFTAWRDLLMDGELPARPRGTDVRRIFSEAVSESGNRPAAMGLVHVQSDRVDELQSAVANAEGIYITGWQTMGSVIQPLVKRDLRMVFIPMALVLLVMLAVVFRDFREVVLAVAVLVLSAVALLAIMRVAGWQWNVLNICAFPLLLGTGIDYTIHMIGSLRRHGGAREPVRRGIGRALLFCGISTAIGFGALSLANNAGLASLGKVCAAGILAVMMVAVFLLPGWWRLIKGRDSRAE